VRLVLLGMGRMGQVVARLAREAGHEIVAELDIDESLGRGPVPAEIRGADVAIDFTVPEAVLGSVRSLADAGIPVVVGTTGWNAQLEDVRKIVTSKGTALVYGSNFSIGANILLSLVTEAARLVERFEEYDPYVLDHHHRLKADTPSGTALRLAASLVENLSRKDRIESGTLTGRIDERALHVVGIRAGSAFGRHVVGFDSEADTIEIAHTAKGREGFARGALFAAEWIVGKKGVFEFHELFEGRLS
jgi:4-hydroxy-tetrahydrodipicolinate reductase